MEITCGASRTRGRFRSSSARCRHALQIVPRVVRGVPPCAGSSALSTCAPDCTARLGRTKAREGRTLGPTVGWRGPRGG